MEVKCHFKNLGKDTLNSNGYDNILLKVKTSRP